MTKLKSMIGSICLFALVIFLYNFSQSSRKSYYNGMFIVKNEFVDEHLEKVGYKDNDVRHMHVVQLNLYILHYYLFYLHVCNEIYT